MKSDLFLSTLITAAALLLPAAASAQNIDPPEVVGEVEPLADSAADAEVMEMLSANETGRQSFFAPKSSRGTTIPIQISVIEELCGDGDGCQVRIGMYDWDGTGRTASREFLFYYNNSLRNWRASLGDPQGQDANNIIEHVNNSWSCYFTDGEYSNWSGGDTEVQFGLLSWNQFNAACILTLID